MTHPVPPSPLRPAPSQDGAHTSPVPSSPPYKGDGDGDGAHKRSRGTHDSPQRTQTAGRGTPGALSLRQSQGPNAGKRCAAVSNRVSIAVLLAAITGSDLRIRADGRAVVYCGRPLEHLNQDHLPSNDQGLSESRPDGVTPPAYAHRQDRVLDSRSGPGHR